MRRPITLLMLAVGLIVVGAVAWQRIPLQRLPTGFEPPFAQLVFVAPNRTAEANERQIAIPAEGLLRTVRGLKHMRAKIRDQSVVFDLEFEEGIDMAEVTNEIRDRTDRLQPELPDDVERPGLRKFDPDGFPVTWLTVRPPTHSASGDLESLLQREVVRRLERIDGVSSVELWGLVGREVVVSVSPQRAEARGVGIAEVIRALEGADVAVTAGSVGPPHRRERISALAPLNGLEGLRNLPIRDGVRLAEVAEVGIRPKEGIELQRIDGDRAVTLAVFKSGDANAVDVCREIRAAIASRFGGAPELMDFDFVTLFDQGAAIEASMADLGGSGLWGGLIAVAVLFLFLRAIRVTLLIASAIPLSLLITLVALYATGESLNALSLMGLMLSVGMVVDNTIVVTESIQRRRELGDPPARAAALGASEVATAVVTATLTSVVVFLPVIFLSGSETLGFYLSKVGFPVCYSLLGSLVVALVFVPAASARMLPAPRTARVSPEAPSLGARAYRSALDRMLRHPFDGVIAIAVLVWATVAISDLVPESEGAEGNINDIRVSLEFPSEYGPDDVDSSLAQLEGQLFGARAELGAAHVFIRTRNDPGDAEARLFLVPPEEQPSDRSALLQRTSDLVDAWAPPGVRWKLGWQGARRGADEGAIEVRVRGHDAEVVAALVSEVERRLLELPEVLGVGGENERESTTALALQLDSRRLERFGLSPMQVAAQVTYHTAGRRVGRIWLGSEQWDLNVMTDPAARTSIEDVQALRVESLAAGPGASSPWQPRLSEVSTATTTATERIRRRESRQSSTTLAVRVADTPEEDAKKLVSDALATTSWPPGYGWDFGRSGMRLQDAKSEQGFTLLLAIALVFLLMGVLFESIVLPFIVVAAVPFAFTGAFWVLLATGTPYDLMAKVGLIILVGVVVNNAIVLVDRIVQLESEGVPLRSAIGQGASDRLRPVLMTAATTICGLIPMVLGHGGIFGISYRPLGLAVMGGLASGTVITLFLVPLLVLFARARRSPAPAAAG